MQAPACTCARDRLTPSTLQPGVREVPTENFYSAAQSALLHSVSCFLFCYVWPVLSFCVYL